MPIDGGNMKKIIVVLVVVIFTDSFLFPETNATQLKKSPTVEEIQWREELLSARSTRATWFLVGGLSASVSSIWLASTPYDASLTGPIVLLGIGVIGCVGGLTANGRVKELEKEGLEKGYRMYYSINLTPSKLILAGNYKF